LSQRQRHSAQVLGLTPKSLDTKSQFSWGLQSKIT